MSFYNIFEFELVKLNDFLKTNICCITDYIKPKTICNCDSTFLYFQIEVFRAATELAQYCGREKVKAEDLGFAKKHMIKRKPDSDQK
jgi:hypothetical protein